jgi:hypothetical protein
MQSWPGSCAAGRAEALHLQGLLIHRRKDRGNYGWILCVWCYVRSFGPAACPGGLAKPRACIPTTRGLTYPNNPPGGAPMHAMTVHVDRSVGGTWEIALSDRREPVVCKSLEEASRMAHRCAAERHPCELVVRDAYHRVLRHELINVGGGPRGRSASKARGLS